MSVFYDEMIEKDRFKPTLWLYKHLMKIVARAGYTHMAFALFKKVKIQNAFSTDFFRTRETLEPLILEKKLDLKIYNPKEIPKFVEKTKGEIPPAIYYTSHSENGTRESGFTNQM